MGSISSFVTTGEAKFGQIGTTHLLHLVLRAAFTQRRRAREFLRRTCFPSCWRISVSYTLLYILPSFVLTYFLYIPPPSVFTRVVTVHLSRSHSLCLTEILYSSVITFYSRSYTRRQHLPSSPRVVVNDLFLRLSQNQSQTKRLRT